MGRCWVVINGGAEACKSGLPSLPCLGPLPSPLSSAPCPPLSLFSPCSPFSSTPIPPHLVSHELRACLEHVGQQPLEQGLKALPVLGGDAVPVLGGAIVQVVDGVEVEVLAVPGGEQGGGKCVRVW